MSETTAETTTEGYSYEPPARLYEIPATIGSRATYDPEQFSNGSGWPTAGTRVTEEDADRIVVNREQLLDAMSTASKGDVIWLPGWVEIDLSGVTSHEVGAADVTLASDRGQDSEGALLTVEKPKESYGQKQKGIFDIRKPGFRLTGLRAIGAQTTYNEWDDYIHEGGTMVPISFVEVRGDNVEIDNIVGRGFGHAPIVIGRATFTKKTHVHHCDLVDNPQDALGYGVAISHAKPLIQYNYFDNCRHAVAGGGQHDCNYVCRFNLFGPRGILHQIDMHSNKAPDGQGSQGGQRVSIWGNEVMFHKNRRNGRPQEAIKFRDVPREGGQVLKNRFHHPRARFDEKGLGQDGSAILLEVPDKQIFSTLSSLLDAGIETEANYSEGDDEEPPGIPPEAGPNPEGAPNDNPSTGGG